MRMNEGRETWHRLLEWDRGQAPSERLAAIILSNGGFKNVDPSHPLGGKDGLKDMVLSFESKRWIGGVYFPRGQQEFSDIKLKFTHDLEGVKKNGANGFAFITNQELRLSERKALSEVDENIDTQIYHLERIASLLNTPPFYGVRMEFLDIEMSKEEQLAYFADRDQKISAIEATLERLAIGLDEYKMIHQMPKPEIQANEDDDYYDEQPRTIDEVSEASEEFYEKIWFDRHMSLKFRIENGLETVEPEIWKGAMKAENRMIKKYGEDNLGPYSDFEWGMLNGKLSALRWVLGCEWDMLDT